MPQHLQRCPQADRLSRVLFRISAVGCSRGVDRHQLWRRPSDMAVIQSEAGAGTASGRRSAARFATEAVGNFVLVFAFAVAIATHSWFSPLLVGVPLVAMVYSGNRVPGGHYNPALTIAMLIRHRLALRTALAFWLVQFSAGLLAAVSVRAIVDPRQLAVTAAMTLKGPTLVAAFALELVLTCALCCVALEVSTRNSHTVDDYYAWPIAFSVIAGAIVIGAITNGAFDPAVSFDDALLGVFSWPTLRSTWWRNCSLESPPRSHS
jgi:aquaporin Z